MAEKDIAQPEPTATNAASAPVANGPDSATAALAAYAARAVQAESKLQEIEASRQSAAAKHIEELAANGKHKELADSYASKLAEAEKTLASLQEDAGYGRSWRETESARIASISEQMTPEWKEMLETAASLPAKAKLVALFEKTQAQASEALSSPSASKAKAPVMGVPAPAANSFDLVKMIATGQLSVGEAERRFPAEYAAQVEANAAGTHKPKRRLFGL